MAEHHASVYGTEKDKLNCPFYVKIGACRHGDRCSRVHNKPLFSQTIMLHNLYQSPQQMIKSAVSNGLPPPSIPPDDRVHHFDDFYLDILDEMSRHGPVQTIAICRNSSDHLAGNTYVKFAHEQAASRALAAIQGRMYDGRAIRAELSPVNDFREGKCRPFENNGRCDRHDYCQFMHLYTSPEPVHPPLPYAPQDGVDEHIDRPNDAPNGSTNGNPNGNVNGNGSGIDVTAPHPHAPPMDTRIPTSPSYSRVRDRSPDRYDPEYARDRKRARPYDGGRYNETGRERERERESSRDRGRSGDREREHNKDRSRDRDRDRDRDRFDRSRDRGRDRQRGGRDRDRERDRDRDRDRGRDRGRDRHYGRPESPSRVYRSPDKQYSRDRDDRDRGRNDRGRDRGRSKDNNPAWREDSSKLNGQSRDHSEQQQYVNNNRNQNGDSLRQQSHPQQNGAASSDIINTSVLNIGSNANMSSMLASIGIDVTNSESITSSKIDPSNYQSADSQALHEQHEQQQQPQEEMKSELHLEEGQLKPEPQLEQQKQKQYGRQLEENNNHNANGDRHYSANDSGYSSKEIKREADSAIGTRNKDSRYGGRYESGSNGTYRRGGRADGGGARDRYPSSNRRSYDYEGRY